MSEPIITGTEGTGEESGSSLSSISVIETIIPPMSISELTEVKFEGAGVLDTLLRNLDLHLTREWDRERITGPEYARAYIELYQSTLQAAIEYSHRRTRLGYELKNLENDAKYKEAQIDIARAELTKLPHEIERLQAETARVNADTTQRIPAEVSNLQKQGELLTQQVLESEYRVANVLPKELEQITAQVALAETEKDIAVFNLANKAPIEVSILEAQAEIAIKDSQLKFAQIAQTQAQTELTEQQTKSAEAEAHKIPVEISLLRSNLELAGVEKDLRIAQVALAETEKDIAVYNLANKTPVEVELLQAQTDNAQSQIALTEAQVIKITEENKVIPYNIERIQAEIANMTRQSDILEKELEIKISNLALQDKQLLLADAELEVRRLELDVKRAEVEAAQAQAELYAAKVLTENAQTMDAAHPNSVLGSNIAVLRAQAAGYARDAEQKATKILVDAWNVQRNTDEAISANAENLLYDTSIGKAVAAMLRGAGI